ncbi:hypothetical protein JXA48_04460 [Candidatus Woesearchaeota archaeon]|nr:hypothetical protein [Candidatus Woesearchaeota archaeon]
MVKPEILEKRPVSIPEVKDMLKAIHKRDDELSFRGGKTEDYVNEVAQLTSKKAKDLSKAIEDLDIPRLKPEHIVKIIDTLPDTPEHLKVILSGFNVTITKENLKKIVDALDEFRPAK